MRFELARSKPILTKFDAFASTSRTKSVFVQLGVGVFASDWQNCEVRAFRPSTELRISTCYGEVILVFILALNDLYVSRFQVFAPAQWIGILIRERSIFQ